MLRPAFSLMALVLVAGGYAWGQPVDQVPDVARITTDTATYCAQLAAEAEAALLTGDAKLLHDQGLRLCAQGQVQAGIARLRRALLLTRSSPQR